MITMNVVIVFVSKQWMINNDTCLVFTIGHDSLHLLVDVLLWLLLFLQSVIVIFIIRNEPQSLLNKLNTPIA